jgi:glycosyltransferase involved in cell wall biosynthesis
MNLGYLTNVVWNASSGASLLTVLKQLKEYKPEVKLYVLGTDSKSEEDLKLFTSIATVTIDRSISRMPVLSGTRPSLWRYVIATLRARVDAEKVLSFVRTNKIDLLHVNTSVFSHLYPYLKKDPVCLVTHVRENIFVYGPSLIPKRIVKNIEQYSDRIICIGPVEARPFKSKVDIVPNASNFFRLTSKNMLQQQPLNILMMGRWARDKGQLLLLDAIRVLQDLKPPLNLQFTILGYEDPRNWPYRLLKMCVKLELDFHLIIAFKIKELSRRHSGSVSLEVKRFTNDVTTYLDRADIYVRPSLSCDPWGRDIIEAMSFGVPIVATGHDSFFVQPGITGFLCKPDARELAEKIALLAGNELLRKSMQEQSIKFSKATFAPTEHIAKIRRCYRAAGLDV